MPNVLGISAQYHDSSAALIRHGEVVAAAAEDRFTRIKHDSSIPSFAAQFCLQQAGVSASDLDAVVFYERPVEKFSRVLSSTLADFPRSRAAFVDGMRAWLGGRLWIQNALARDLQISPRKIAFASHHESHVAHAYFTSGFERAAILTVDAVGEWTCTAIGHGDGEGIRTLEEIPYPNSLGLLYAAFTAFLGFDPNDSECSTMALAAFGRPIYLDHVGRILRISADGTYDVDSTYFDFLAQDRRLFNDGFLRLFGEPRDPRSALPFGPEFVGASTGAAQRFADVAASVQLALEEALLGLARRAHRLSGAENLCVAGGVAMNSVAIGRIVREGPFREVFVPSDPGDGGGAIGAALLWNRNRARSPTRVGPFLGKHYATDGLEEVIAGMSRETPHRTVSSALPPSSTQIEVRRVAPERVPEVIVREVLNERIVGIHVGRFESGPRALGNRSILVDPSSSRALARLSTRVKRRAAFRPYALSVLEDDCRRLFGWEHGTLIQPVARGMQMVEMVKTEHAGGVGGGLHVDGTTRPQVCGPEDNQHLYDVLRLVKQQRGVGALLNTSFNESGSPMVASPMDALLMFVRTDIDTLVIGDLIVTKR